MNKTKIIASVLIAFSFLLVLGTAYAYRGDVTQTGPNYDPVVHDSLRTAIEVGDYQAWNDIVSSRDNKSKISVYITEDNFSEYSKAYVKAVSGNPQALQDFRASLGLGQGNQYRGSRDGTLNENGKFLEKKTMKRNSLSR
jgi:hypothetical protein